MELSLFEEEERTISYLPMNLSNGFTKDDDDDDDDNTTDIKHREALSLSPQHHPVKGCSKEKLLLLLSKSR